MKTGFQNLEHGHQPKQHVSNVLSVISNLDLKVFGVSEGRDYLAEFKLQAPKAGYQVLHAGKKRGSNQCYILAKDDLKIDHGPWSFRAGTGWWRVGGGWMAPMRPCAATIEGITFVAGHAPVGAWITGGWKGRKFAGAALRRIAYKGFVNRLKKLFNRHPHVVVWADWNATPDTLGIWSPNWLRRKVYGKFIRPHASTGHGEIDFAVSTGIVVTEAHVGPKTGSDHNLVWAETAKV